MLHHSALLRCLCALRQAPAPLARRAFAAAAAAPAAAAAADAGEAGEEAALTAPPNPALPADSVIRVSSSRNNMHITVSDLEGRVVSRSSGGMVGFKHRERASTEAAEAAAGQATAKAAAKGFRMSHLEMKGSSAGRGQVLRGILLAGLSVKSIRDTTPVPTPGVRPPASRRL
jgi:small subunit ribosomal protein S11